MKKMIDRGKRSKTLRVVKPVENISKNPQSFLEISPVQKEVLQGIIQKKSASGSRMLPFVIFDKKCPFCQN